MASPVIDSLQAQLMRDEGLRLKLYLDSAHKLTIGYGRNITDHGITAGEAVLLLDNDITRVHLELVRALPWAISLDEARAGVLLNMTFNMGIADLLKFHQFIDLVHAGEYDAAAADMLGTLWAKEVGDRAGRLSKQMETGQWQ